MSTFVKYWLPLAFWAIVIFLFSSLQTSPVSKVYWQEFLTKKLAHIVVYFILAFFMYRGLVNNGIEKKKAGIWSIVLSFVYGVTDEYHQSFTPGREPRARDVVFDTIGAALAIATIWKYLPKAPKRLRNLAKSLQVI